MVSVESCSGVWGGWWAGLRPTRPMGSSLALDEDAVVPVELEDLAQPLLGGGHALFGSLACGQKVRGLITE